jgi:hypothetical protein
MNRRVRRLLSLLAIGCLCVVGSFSWSPPAASAQGLDLCDLLGGTYCPPGGGNGEVTCTSAAPVGGVGTCTVSNVEVGDHLVAKLVCGDFSATIFDGAVTAVPLVFSFEVPDGAPLGSCTIQINGASLPFTVIGGESLARTGSDVGPLLGIGAGLMAVGIAAAFSARRRLRSAQPV